MAGARHILVTGGAGFIGSHLVERLLRDGEHVVVIDDCSTGRLENLEAVRGHSRLRLIHERVSECPALQEVVEQAVGVYHLAAAVGVELVLRSPVHTLRTNLHETETLLEVASRFKVPVLLASSSEVYGRSTKTEFAEDDDLLIGPPQVDRWSYACSKLMDEFLAMAYHREFGLPIVIARLFNTVGPRQRGHYGMVLPRFIQAAREGSPLRVYGDGSQTRCFCYVLDVVEALVRLMNSPKARGQVLNVGSTEEVTIRELAERVREVIGGASTIELVPYAEAYAANVSFEDMRRRKPCLNRLERMIGFRPTTPLRRIIELTAGGPGSEPLT